MPLTVTLDPDVAERIEQEVHREGKPAQVVVNEALRNRLGLKGDSPLQEPFHMQHHGFGFIAGLNLDKMNQLADELEAARQLRRG